MPTAITGAAVVVVVKVVEVVKEVGRRPYYLRSCIYSGSVGWSFERGS